MPTDILMPALSPTMEEGTLAKWHVREGQSVQTGDVIAEIETDKATMEVEAIEDGVIQSILVPEGTEHVAVNQPIAVLLLEDDEAPAEGAPAVAPQPTVSEPAAAAPPQAPAAQAPSPGLGETEPEVETAPAGPQSRTVRAAPEPEVPAGTEMVDMTVREALRDAMAEEMRREAMSSWARRSPNTRAPTRSRKGCWRSSAAAAHRYADHGVWFAGIGVGAAFAGLRPVVEFMTWNFAMQAIDHIVNSAAKTLYMSGGQMHCPIVFRGPNGAAARVAAQHSQDFSSVYAQVPGLKVIAPYSAADAKGLLKAAIRENSPVVFLENEILYGQSFPVPKLDNFVLPIGKARIARAGKDVTLVSYSRGLAYAIDAAERLAAQGIDAEIIDLRTLRPLDMETVLTSVRKTNRIVTVEEGWPVCSVGTEICAQVTAQAFDYLDAPPLKITGADVPMPYAANLEKLALPSVELVVSAAKSVCYRENAA
ncbi:pyruvate dehydrogenase complex E1 component subunit beta [Methyloceanibacter methanicus]|uniref:pyruvate dehydrogenase complex E1 component subunit beta n=1 Tax=Methyloceanibacter methanicus TaxID=1774968 RepID=UPI000B24E971